MEQSVTPQRKQLIGGGTGWEVQFRLTRKSPMPVALVLGDVADTHSVVSWVGIQCLVTHAWPIPQEEEKSVLRHRHCLPQEPPNLGTET